jgi:excisionase family DNA binding protein
LSTNGTAPRRRDYLSDHPVLRGRPRAASPAVKRRALRPEEAAESLGVSIDFFRAHVAPDLKLVRKGRLRLVPVTEIDKWLDDNAHRAL